MHGILAALALGALIPTPTRTPTPFRGTNERAVYRLSWIQKADPLLGSVRLPDVGNDTKMTPERCPGFKWWVNERGGTVIVEAPTALHTALSADYARADGWRGWADGFAGLFALPAHAFGGDQFIFDTSANYTAETDTLQGTWSWPGNILTLTGGTGDCRQIRNTDASVNQTVWSRGQTTNDGTGPFGMVANRQSNTQFYLSYGVSDQWRIYYKNTTYTQLAATASTIANDTYYVTKLETVTDGTNKILTLSVGGSVMTGPVTTTTLYGSGGYGVDGNASSGSTITWDWLIADPAMAITGFAEKAACSNGPVTLNGTGFGDGYEIRAGGRTFPGSAYTGTTQLQRNTPTLLNGVYPITVVFGTLGSEEFTATQGAALNIFTASGVRDRRP